MGVWLTSFFRWLMHGRLFWLALFVATFALALAFTPGTSEQRIRVIGWLLELSGLATVAWGIRDTRRQFGHPGLLSLGRSWLARFPKLHPEPIDGSLHAKLTGASLITAAGLVVGKALDGTVDARLRAIEGDVAALVKRVDKAEGELARESEARIADVGQERMIRERDINGLNEKFEAIETGGLHLSAMGLVWLAVGLTLSTIPAELLELWGSAWRIG